MMRPVPVRVAPGSRAQKATEASAATLLNLTNAALGQAQHQHKSAWARSATSHPFPTSSHRALQPLTVSVDRCPFCCRYENREDSHSQSPPPKRQGSPVRLPSRQAQVRREEPHQEIPEDISEPRRSPSPSAHSQRSAPNGGQAGATLPNGMPAHFDIQAAYLNSLKAALMANLGRGEAPRGAPPSPPSSYQQSMPGALLPH